MKLVVSNLPDDITKQDLETLFGAFGRVEHIRLLYNIYTKEFRRMAYVDLTPDTGAQEAVTHLTGFVMGKHEICIEKVISKKL